MKVGVLGPKGTYSEAAARSHFGGDIEAVTYPLITDIAEAVKRGEVPVGVVPVESLREGTVGETLDALAWLEVKIQAEIVVSVSHCLLGAKGADLDEIRQILSHPQALAQCREFLRKNLQNAELVGMPSTAEAARQVKKSNRTHMAAIGSKELAELYGLEVLCEKIQTGKENSTRFLCLAKEDSKPTGRDKTSIVFYAEEDRPGILQEILQELALRRINLTKIESRPSKKALGDYLFFADFEGHRDDPSIKEALKAIRAKVAMLKVLGSYPRRF